MHEQINKNFENIKSLQLELKNILLEIELGFNLHNDPDSIRIIKRLERFKNAKEIIKVKITRTNS